MSDLISGSEHFDDILLASNLNQDIENREIECFFYFKWSA